MDPSSRTRERLTAVLLLRRRLWLAHTKFRIIIYPIISPCNLRNCFHTFSNESSVVVLDIGRQGSTFPFYCPKFLTTFSRLYFVWNLIITYMTSFSWPKTSISDKNIPPQHLFLVSSYFASHPITVLLKILGGRMHGPSPTSNVFWGSSPSIPKSPPMYRAFLIVDPSACNSLPYELRSLPRDLSNSFYKLLQTVIFARAWAGSASE